MCQKLLRDVNQAATRPHPQSLAPSFSFTMVRSVFFAGLVLFAFLLQGVLSFLFFFVFLSTYFVAYAEPSEEQKLRDEYGLDSNNYYVDEDDEYIAGQGAEGELTESHGFDFVVESEEDEEELDAESLRLQFARGNFMTSYYLFPSSKDSRGCFYFFRLEDFDFKRSICSVFIGRGERTSCCLD
jgi:hypothetical protein